MNTLLKANLILKAAASNDTLKRLGSPAKYSTEDLQALSHNAGSKARNSVKQKLVPGMFSNAPTKPSNLSSAVASNGGYSTSSMDSMLKDRGVRRWAKNELQRRGK